MPDPELVEDVVDADARILYSDGTEEDIDFLDLMDYVNKPLERERVEDYLEAGKKISVMARTDIDRELPIEEMARNYYDHIDEFTIAIDLHYDRDNDGRIEKTRTLYGDPRTDVDMRTGVFPSVLPLQFEDSEEMLVLREMETYSRDFIKYIAKEATFTGRNGSSFDWEYTDSITEDEIVPNRDANTFAYVPEPLDFLAINGINGYHEAVSEIDELPYVSVPDWSIITADENEGKLVGIRPFYDNIWEAGVSTTEAEKLGRWRGANRGLGRTIHDMDDEFFHGYNGNDHFVGFWDDEFPFAVGSEAAFNGDEWHRFKKNLDEQADVSETWFQHIVNVVRDNERETAETVKDHDITYSDFLEGKFDTSRIPKEKRANKIF